MSSIYTVYEVFAHLKYNLCLFCRVRDKLNFRVILTVSDQHIKGDSRSKKGLSVLPGQFYIGVAYYSPLSFIEPKNGAYNPKLKV